MIKKNLSNEGKGLNSAMKDELFPTENLSKVARIPGLSALRKGRQVLRMRRNIGHIGGAPGKEVAKEVAASRTALLSKNRALAGIDPNSLGVRGRFMQNRRMGQLQKTIGKLGPESKVVKPKVVKPKVVKPVTTTPKVTDVTGKPKKTKTYFTKRQFGKVTIGGGALLGGGYLAGLGSGKSQRKYNQYYN